MTNRDRNFLLKCLAELRMGQTAETVRAILISEVERIVGATSGKGTRADLPQAAPAKQQTLGEKWAEKCVKEIDDTCAIRLNPLWTWYRFSASLTIMRRNIASIIDAAIAEDRANRPADDAAISDAVAEERERLIGVAKNLLAQNFGYVDSSCDKFERYMRAGTPAPAPKDDLAKAIAGIVKDYPERSFTLYKHQDYFAESRLTGVLDTRCGRHGLTALEAVNALSGALAAMPEPRR